ncbi:hypothetical protein PBRA_006530 [Plasmodiophora brassicae]|uniref:Uncharacterized protein n=1 Tax=Plasmodiophora brassicae TaxID=37360 RepID=A0A0G4ITH8_PLABS|nr:hypothetical protein PBRA_006530 [Plasmodiophora brassicae]
MSRASTLSLVIPNRSRAVCDTAVTNPSRRSTTICTSSWFIAVTMPRYDSAMPLFSTNAFRRDRDSQTFLRTMAVCAREIGSGTARAQSAPEPTKGGPRQTEQGLGGVVDVRDLAERARVAADDDDSRPVAEERAAERLVVRARLLRLLQRRRALFQGLTAAGVVPEIRQELCKLTQR